MWVCRENVETCDQHLVRLSAGFLCRRAGKYRQKEETCASGWEFREFEASTLLQILARSSKDVDLGRMLAVPQQKRGKKVANTELY